MGGGPGPPEYPKQVLYFTAPFANGLHMHVLYTYATHLFSIQGGRIILGNVAKYIAIRRRKLLKGRGARGQPPYSKKGLFFTVYNYRRSAGSPWPDYDVDNTINMIIIISLRNI